MLYGNQQVHECLKLKLRFLRQNFQNLLQKQGSILWSSRRPDCRNHLCSSQHSSRSILAEQSIRLELL
uniref:DUF2066 domain-containing protein n=1 Tax=Chryseobacterium aquaeductus TaxID=2675056 RepID=UPI00374261D1